MTGNDENRLAFAQVKVFGEADFKIESTSNTLKVECKEATSNEF